jgi:hypothetical protein
LRLEDAIETLGILAFGGHGVGVSVFGTFFRY